MAITGSISFASSFGQTAPDIPSTSLVTLSNPQAAKFNASVSGTLANQVDLKYSRTLTLTATPTALDLTALTDVFGGAVNFHRVKTVSVVNRSVTDGAVVTLGYGTTTANAWTGLVSNPGTIAVGPSTAQAVGFLAMSSPNTTGWAVGSTSRLIQFDPGSSTITVDVEITGCSA
jgi:hypothetical protein